MAFFLFEQIILRGSIFSLADTSAVVAVVVYFILEL